MRYLTSYPSLILFSIFLVTLAYFQIGVVGFYLDDYSSIVNNPAIIPPATIENIWQFSKARFFAYLLLAKQNAYFDGAEYFHYVGVFIHLACSVLVGILACQLVSLSKADTKFNLVTQKEVFFFTFLLYALIPQNTQTVIYIVQQTTLLVTFFYLAALSSYIAARNNNGEKISALYFLITIVCAIAAMMTKQNAVTLPVALLLVEWVFFGALLKRALIVIVVIGALTILLLLFYFGLEQSISLINKYSVETKEITRVDYFRSQLGIIFHYIFQYFAPISLRLEYDWLVVTNWDFKSIGQLFAHLLVISVALILRKTNKIVTFGVIFYYLALSVESSIVPIKDIVFEHRTYLPNAGLTILLVISLVSLLKRPTLRYGVQTAVLVLCCIGTANRVQQWGDREQFYLNEVELSPLNARAYTALATTFQEQGNCAKAIGYYDHAMALYRKVSTAYDLGLQPETIQNYIICLRNLQIYQKANDLEQSLLQQVTNPVRRAEVLFQRGTFKLQQREFLAAEKYLTDSIKLNGKNYSTAVNLAITKVQLGKRGHAIKLLEHAIALKPDDQKLRAMLAKVRNIK